MSEKRISYKGKEVTITFSPDICIHAAECVNGSPEVFDVNKKPWINADAAPVDKIIATINKCPSGALKYEISDNIEKPEENEMEQTKVTVMPDGPVMVQGNLVVNKMSGEEIKQAEKIFLCRCGHSSNKPFCDGAHKKEDFKAE